MDSQTGKGESPSSRFSARRQILQRAQASHSAFFLLRVLALPKRDWTRPFHSETKRRCRTTSYSPGPDPRAGSLGRNKRGNRQRLFPSTRTTRVCVSRLLHRLQETDWGRPACPTHTQSV